MGFKIDTLVKIQAGYQAKAVHCKRDIDVET